MSSPMRCAGCGGTMNHHADKMIYADDQEQIEEFHECPACGAQASRVAEQQLP